VGAGVPQLDYVGIVSLIACSYFPVIYYCFQCLPAIRFAYLGTVMVLAAGCILVSSVEVFQENKYMPFRAAVFTGACTFVCPPATAHVGSERIHTCVPPPRREARGRGKRV
jgi:predicted membrane channel-forming protein YqfA (hemolysin III family)